VEVTETEVDAKKRNGAADTRYQTADSRMGVGTKRHLRGHGDDVVWPQAFLEQVLQKLRIHSEVRNQLPVRS
jgi:hypothetical protein